MLLTCPHCQTRNRLDPARLGARPHCGGCKRPLLEGAPLALDAAAGGELIAHAPLPLVVDFWAPWCGPCRSFAPTFAAAAQAHAGRLVFAKVDTEAETALAATHAIRSIPTLALFRGGAERARVSGALPAREFERWLLANAG
ncbi:thioredoxin [Plasticicumulans lactativorans]|uniref:Thioredoxin n=1 Tax=Plasticicumulans lactativorans TaxID=1133106 RepID=A0A4R2L4H8_9GAMM|nr:thioredoxin TrxC [Plasticicumulans lactativorans]TCO81504.1 thioredoxin [Plasticicumulans lactativorans]